MLRQTGDKTYKVVGECYLYGILDGEALLGPLPPGWHVKLVMNNTGFHEPRFCNSNTNTMVREDPRLGQVPPEWESLDQEQTPEDALLFAPHRNNITGEVINSDPRLFPEALIARGVKLETFRLV